METKENFLQKFFSFYERIAKRVVILNLFIEVSFFIASCNIFMLFSTFYFMISQLFLKNYRQATA